MPMNADTKRPQENSAPFSQRTWKKVVQQKRKPLDNNNPGKHPRKNCVALHPSPPARPSRKPRFPVFAFTFIPAGQYQAPNLVSLETKWGACTWRKRGPFLSCCWVGVIRVLVESSKQVAPFSFQSGWYQSRPPGEPAQQ